MQNQDGSYPFLSHLSQSKLFFRNLKDKEWQFSLTMVIKPKSIQTFVRLIFLDSNCKKFFSWNSFSIIRPFFLLIHLTKRGHSWYLLHSKIMYILAWMFPYRRTILPKENNISILRRAHFLTIEPLKITFRILILM